ncbi:MAG TPA: YciI family protein [Roseiarcus sp.]|nr:YciI family protein [Roseiarcus sp.]
MRVMVIVKATNDSEDGKLPTPELIEQMGAFNQQLMDAGIFVDGAGVKPSAKGARVAFSGLDRSVTKGPFPNVHELVAGYWIWQVNDLDEAIEWVKRCPNPMPGPSVIEIREFYEMDDFDRPK